MRLLLITIGIIVLMGIQYFLLMSSGPSEPEKNFIRGLFLAGLLFIAIRSYRKFKSEREDEKYDKEKEYERWCDSGSPEEKILQSICDAIIQNHDWDGMPRIKVRVFDPAPEGGITFFQKLSLRDGRAIHQQYIKVDKAYMKINDAEDLAWDMKEALIQAWVDWKDIKSNTKQLAEAKATEVNVDWFKNGHNPPPV